jgi:hypothetical protein
VFGLLFTVQNLRAEIEYGRGLAARNVPDEAIPHFIAAAQIFPYRYVFRNGPREYLFFLASTNRTATITLRR